MRRVIAATVVSLPVLAFAACGGDQAAGPTMPEDDRVAVLSGLGNPDLWVGPEGDDANPGLERAHSARSRRRSTPRRTEARPASR